MNLQNKRILASVLFVLISFACMSQGPDSFAPPPGLPIDGGVLISVFVAIIYGVKKILGNK